MANNPRIRWCFTLNNYTNLIEKIEQAKRWVIGEEIGEQGTKHLQGYVEFKTKIRFNTVKNRLPNGAHIEPANGSPEQNYNYCIKEGKYKTFGTFSFKQNSSEEVIDGLLKGDKLVERSIHYIRYKKSYDEIVSKIKADERKEELRQEYEKLELSELQLDIVDYLAGQPARQVLWVTDIDGGTGKSTLARYLWLLCGFQLFDGIMKSCDIAFMLDPECCGFVLDVTRDNANYFNYTTLEQLKNGYITTGKYAGRTVFFKPKPVVIFSNFFPKVEKLTKDRWVILFIKNGKVEDVFSEDTGFPQECLTLPVV